MGLRPEVDSADECRRARGELAGVARGPGFRLSGEIILPGLRLIVGRREFASSLTSDEDGPSPVRDDPESPGSRGSTHELAALDHRECGRTQIAANLTPWVLSGLFASDTGLLRP
jgi:hypothetical protein